MVIILLTLFVKFIKFLKTNNFTFQFVWKIICSKNCSNFNCRYVLSNNNNSSQYKILVDIRRYRWKFEDCERDDSRCDSHWRQNLFLSLLSHCDISDLLEGFPCLQPRNPHRSNSFGTSECLTSTRLKHVFARRHNSGNNFSVAK